MTRLLVVDDELRICRFVGRALEAYGFQVDTATTGSDALRVAREARYELIILDLLMPTLDGYEVLRQLLEDDGARRVLVLSAVGDVESKVRCLRMGAVDYLAKPFAIAELVERVKHRLDEPAHPVVARWLDVGGIQLDLQRRRVRKGERDISLSNREFVLLSHLMRHPNIVCSRAELLGELWGYSFDPGSNIVDVYVRKLRTKVAHDRIETVRNVGYCFVGS